MAPRRRARRPWHRTRTFRLTRTAVLAVVLVTVGVRCGGPDAPVAPARAGAAASDGTPGDPAPGGRADEEGRDAGEKPAERPKSPPRPLPRSPATTLRVPSLGIDAPIVPLRLGPDRHLGTPPLDKPKLVGWYAGGPTPGERGTAVVVGHRDTKTGPAVFAGLARVPRGARIEARRADGRTAVYTVDRVRVFDKDTFPDKEVYGPSKRPELRVLTCGGLFRRATGYTSNVVVFAHLTATR
ncbi:class F sortase [Streptomyces sp. NY05-11A]|uniref:class F sortase n=1 Tax=Streptomyces soliscabiei TaxID=588897 RepID=UPI0029AD3EAE|nr:class F sortase [Streptomyces sp. NY05-11A]MDX2676297.1 class F sortase [Streptomyces sp. NY05-11A]